MRNQGIVLLEACLISVLAAAVSATGQDVADVPVHVSAELVSADPARRVVVVRNSNGAILSYQMDDLLAGTPGVKPGDRVILTLRGGSGIPRVSAIARAAGPFAMVVVAKSSSLAGPAASDDAGRARVREAFARQVAMLSQDGRPVDSLWSNFVTDCNVQPFNPNDDGRAWFGLWDGRVRADYSTGSCRDAFNQMIAAGEVIKQGMVAAEEVTRRTLTPGEIREIRRVHMMDWDGWALPAPPRREP